MRAFFVSHTPRDYGFWGVLWWVSLAGDDGGGNLGKLKSWSPGIAWCWLMGAYTPFLNQSALLWRGVWIRGAESNGRFLDQGFLEFNNLVEHHREYPGCFLRHVVLFFGVCD